MDVFSIYYTFLFSIAGGIMVGVFDILSLACLLNFQSAFSGLNYPSLSEIGVVNQIFFSSRILFQSH